MSEAWCRSAANEGEFLCHDNSHLAPSELLTTCGMSAGDCAKSKLPLAEPAVLLIVPGVNELLRRRMCLLRSVDESVLCGVRSVPRCTRLDTASTHIFATESRRSIRCTFTCAECGVCGGGADGGGWMDTASPLTRYVAETVVDTPVDSRDGDGNACRIDADISGQAAQIIRSHNFLSLTDLGQRFLLHIAVSSIAVTQPARRPFRLALQFLAFRLHRRSGGRQAEEGGSAVRHLFADRLRPRQRHARPTFDT